MITSAGAERPRSSIYVEWTGVSIADAGVVEMFAGQSDSTRQVVVHKHDG